MTLLIVYIQKYLLMMGKLGFLRVGLVIAHGLSPPTLHAILFGLIIVVLSPPR